MPKITASNVLKIVDVEHSQIKSDTLDFLRNETEPTYRDQVMKEHIYNMENIFEEYQEQPDGSPEVLAELEQLQKLCTKKNAGYVRIVFSN